MALLSGIALSHELLSRYCWHSKNCDPVSVLSIRTSPLFGDHSSSHFPLLDPLAPYSSALPYPGTFSASSAGTLLPLTIAGTSTAE